MDPRLRGGDGRGCRRGVLLLLDLQDVRRALVAREQICAVVGGDKALERLHPREQPDEIVLPSKREHGDEPRGRHLCRSEEHTSELQSLMRTSYAVFCLKKKNTTTES